MAYYEVLPTFLPVVIQSTRYGSGEYFTSTTIRARFANGVLEPLEDPRLNEGDEVLVRIEPLVAGPGLAWLEETAGAWKGLIDADELKRRIEESRLFLTRPQPRF